MTARLKVVLCWHMHQPEYRDPLSGRHALPWTYLHAIKDYVDMVAHLERVPAARAVVNFAPVLLDQIAVYAREARAALDHGTPPRDAVLAALLALPPRSRRLALVRACLRANETRLVARFPAYARLARLARTALEDPPLLAYLDEAFFSDLVTWYHLAWLGETVRRDDPRVRALLERRSGYGEPERHALLAVVADLLDGVVPRYRALAESGRIELSMSPYAHPIVPLLLDFGAARGAQPQAMLPDAPAYPGGRERAAWHVAEGLRTFERHFGMRPRGCWPSEGAVSDDTLALLGAAGLEWAASGEGVIANTLRAAGGADHLPAEAHHRAWRHPGAGEPACFFRSDRLSDLIGFAYATWHGDDAVANLVHELERIATSVPDPGERVVAIILDGENAWEHYPENGYYFLSALYARLSEHPHLELTTFAACLDAGVPTRELPPLVPGSWVYGTLATWMGHADKNRGWDLLCEAKSVYDRVIASGRLDASARAAAERQLAICEGSDWFWWFGDDNPAETVREFDWLYRRQLMALYAALGEPSPAELAHPFTHGGGTPEGGGVMRRATAGE